MWCKDCMNAIIVEKCTLIGIFCDLSCSNSTINQTYHELLYLHYNDSVMTKYNGFIKYNSMGTEWGLARNNNK